MKIFICNFDYFPRSGGHEVFAHNLANHLSRRYDVSVVTRDNTTDIKRHYSLEKIPYNDREMERRPSFSRSLKHFIQNNTGKADLIIANDFFSLMGAKNHENKIYVHHGFFHEHEPRKLIALFFRAKEKSDIIGTSPKKIICVNENDTHVFPESSFIPVGVDMKLFRHISGKRVRAFTFLSTKNFYEICGVREIVRGFSCIDKARLVMAGDGPLRQELEQLDNRIEFLGLVDHWKMPELYSRADAVVFNVKAGIQRTALLEALACGKPVVASRIHPFDRMVNESNGLLFEDDRNLASAMNEIMNKKYNPIGIRKSVKNYDWNNIAKQYVDIIETL